MRLVRDLADDFLKFSAKGEKKEKKGEKKKKGEGKKGKKKERKIAIMIKETVGKVISIHKS